MEEKDIRRVSIEDLNKMDPIDAVKIASVLVDSLVQIERPEVFFSVIGAAVDSWCELHEEDAAERWQMMVRLSKEVDEIVKESVTNEDVRTELWWS